MLVHSRCVPFATAVPLAITTDLTRVLCVLRMPFLSAVRYNQEQEEYLASVDRPQRKLHYLTQGQGESSMAQEKREHALQVFQGPEASRPMTAVLFGCWLLDGQACAQT